MRTEDEVFQEWLILRAQDRDEDALGTLVELWHPRLSRHALRLTGDAEAAREVIQEAWLAIVRGLRRLDDPSRFPAWAYRIVSNKCADWVRQTARRRATISPLDREPPVSDHPGQDSDPIVSLRHALRRLPPEQRAILTMFYLDEMSVRQIAETISIPAGTVKSRLHHARNHLKRALERSGP